MVKFNVLMVKMKSNVVSMHSNFMILRNADVIQKVTKIKFKNELVS